MPKHLEVVAQGDLVTVRNNAIGCSLSFRNGIEVSREGNFATLTKNNREAMAYWAASSTQKAA